MRNEMRNEKEEVLRKLHSQYLKIESTKIPHVHNSEVVGAIQDLEAVLPGTGNVQFKYAKETLIAYKYSQSVVRHYLTNNTMLEDIRAGERIVFNNYK
ncbi:hypothetical protein [Aquibacillus rhizosphaerae]|uniref:Uncharacterized protein n=1 Tax=Aquibacillus rhizosphaerae TaxID=3051431 RepID=A0ABT7LBQ7_9BACI|nr:hypothetical protein [Aquibacillus sp. LR5S19]MDL4842005.1 hypothetical protein [Aquibacillus sp. LR5S19]